MSEREPTGMDEAALTAELAAMAGDVSGAEAVLAQLAAALFPAGGGRLEHMTWGAAVDGGEPAPGEASTFTATPPRSARRRRFAAASASLRASTSCSSRISRLVCA